MAADTSAIEAYEVSDFIEQQCSALYAQETLMQFYIDLATSQTDEVWFGPLYKYAIALRAMHNYCIDTYRERGEAGLLTGMSEDNASVRYWNKTKQASNSDLLSTHYGTRLYSIMKSRGPSISVASSYEG